MQNLTYIEPFVGGGAVLFWILQQYPNIEKAIINDINAELICTYRVIKENVEDLIKELSKYQSDYLPLNDEERKVYYLDRRARYNTHQSDNIETAALFIFLNRTCFNGLYRVNSNGDFNVPFGKYKNPKICDAETLRADSVIFKEWKYYAETLPKQAFTPIKIPYSILIHLINLLQKHLLLHHTPSEDLMIMSR